MSLKKLAGETLIYGVSHVLPRILNFILMTPYLTYKFNRDTSQYGIFSDLYAYATIIIALMVFRMDTAYFRYASKKTEIDERKIFGNSFIILAIISTAVVGLMLLFANQIAEMMHYQNQGYYVKWFAFILAFDAYTTLIYARFRLQRRPMRFMFFRFANVILIILFTLLFLEILPRWMPGLKSSIDHLTGITADLDYVFFANLVASLMVFIMMIPELLKINLSIDKPLLKEIVAYSWPLVIIILAGSINQYAAAPIQKYLLPGSDLERKAAMGIYSGCAKIAILLSLFTTAFNYAAEPFFFNQAKQDKGHSMNGTVAKAFTICACLVILVTYLYVDIMLLIIGSNYRSGASVIPILLMSYLFLGLYYNISIWYKLAEGKTIYGAWIALGAVLVTLAVNYALLPWIGIIGSAWASLACFIFEVAVGYYLGQKYFPISYPVKDIISYCIITSLILVIGYAVRSSIDSQSIKFALNTALILAFCGYVYIFEKQFFNSVLKR